MRLKEHAVAIGDRPDKSIYTHQSIRSLACFQASNQTKIREGTVSGKNRPVADAEEKGNMKKCLAVAVFMVVASLVPLRATSVILPYPSIGVAAGGVMVDTSSLVITYDPATRLARLSGPLNSPGAWKLDIDVTADPDSSVQYSVAGTNFTGVPLAFSISISTPLLLGPYNRITNRVNASGTDGNGDGVTVAGTTQVALSNGAGSSGSGVPAVALGVFTCAGGTSAPSTTNPCPDAFAATTSVPSAIYESLGATVVFTVSPLDSASINGTVVIDHAPEPASLALTLLGLLLVPIGMRLRRKS